MTLFVSAVAASMKTRNVKYFPHRLPGKEAQGTVHIYEEEELNYSLLSSISIDSAITNKLYIESDNVRNKQPKFIMYLKLY